ncbi:MAG TPA: GDSL-type esterase/lipase family protein [Paludibacter sp.]|nr:GDSL-type esterase/lipase family protein [Paludibacter sp.]
MRKKSQTIFRISLIINVILILVISIIAFQFSGKIYDKIASFRSCKIVMLGDSFISRGNWNKDLNRTDIKNSGFGGSTTSHYIGMLKSKVIKFEPEICFIIGGTNDISVGIPLSRTYKNFELIVDTLLKYNIEPVLQSTPFVNQPGDSVVNSKIDSLNHFLNQLATNRKIIYLNINTFLSENKRLKSEYSKDGVHINEKAYKIWISHIKKTLVQKGI